MDSMNTDHDAHDQDMVMLQGGVQDQAYADELIAEHIEMDPARPGADEARVAFYGVPVWAIVGHIVSDRGRSLEDVAAAYDLPFEAVQAAVAYYQRHKAVIDARIAANAAMPD